VSKTHWATRPRQSSLSTAACSASSQAMPIDFKSRVTVSIQFNLGLPGLLLVHEPFAIVWLALVSRRLPCAANAPAISDSADYARCI